MIIRDFFPSAEALDAFIQAMPEGTALIVNQTRGWLHLWQINGKRLLKTITRL